MGPDTFQGVSWSPTFGLGVGKWACLHVVGRDKARSKTQSAYPLPMIKVGPTANPPGWFHIKVRRTPYGEEENNWVLV